MGLEILGHKVEDRITGFTGIATGYVVYLTGCNQVLVAPPLDEKGQIQDAHWFDEQRLETRTPLSARIVLDNSKAPGFDKAAPKK